MAILGETVAFTYSPFKVPFRVSWDKALVFSESQHPGLQNDAPHMSVHLTESLLKTGKVENPKKNEKNRIIRVQCVLY